MGRGFGLSLGAILYVPLLHPAAHVRDAAGQGQQLYRPSLLAGWGHLGFSYRFDRKKGRPVGTHGGPP